MVHSILIFFSQMSRHLIFLKDLKLRFVSLFLLLYSDKGGLVGKWARELVGTTYVAFLLLFLLDKFYFAVSILTMLIF